ncbi:MAG: GNVR domain-containing protein [Candidatus Zixiibacteriota bacterium]
MKEIVDMDRMTLKKISGEAPSPFWDSFVLPLLRYRQMTYTVVGVTVAVALLYCLIIPNQYTSTATILPTSANDQLSELKDLAAGSLGELGLGSMMQAQENSSALYPRVLTSRLISENVLRRSYEFTDGDEEISMTLEDYVDAGNIDRNITALSGLVGIDVDRRTGVISLSVTTEYPKLSAAVVHAYLDELEDYNINYRQSKARDNEQFVATRLDEVKTELKQAEETLSAFQYKNMNYMNASDPQLQQELARLQRDVTVKEGVFLALTKKHELAKVEAAKDVPIVQVLDRGSVPLVKSSPRRSLYMMGALFGSLFFSILLSLWLDLSAKRRFRASLERVITAPELKMNRLESKLVSRASRLADVLDRSGETLNKN